jgi:hypothetical protein
MLLHHRSTRTLLRGSASRTRSLSRRPSAHLPAPRAYGLSCRRSAHLSAPRAYGLSYRRPAHLPALRAHGLARRCSSCGGAAPARSTPGLPRQSAPGRGRPRLTSQCAANRARASRRRTSATTGTGSIRACARSRPRATRRRELDAFPARLRKADGDRLLGRACPMFSLANVPDLFADKLAGLRRWRLAHPPVSACALDRSLFWHELHHLYVVSDFRCSSCAPPTERESAQIKGQPSCSYRDLPYASSAPHVTTSKARRLVIPVKAVA